MTEVTFLDRVNEWLAFACFGFILGVIAGLAWGTPNSTPVESNNVIDSLTKVNDSIKLKVEHLYSVKNAKVIEVSTLNNDSTLKLFYKLVSE